MGYQRCWKSEESAYDALCMRIITYLKEMPVELGKTPEAVKLGTVTEKVEVLVPKIVVSVPIEPLTAVEVVTRAVELTEKTGDTSGEAVVVFKTTNGERDELPLRARLVKGVATGAVVVTVTPSSAK
jgi:hypothetical protein